jgi:hypothetical protein
MLVLLTIVRHIMMKTTDPCISVLKSLFNFHIIVDENVKIGLKMVNPDLQGFTKSDGATS